MSYKVLVLCKAFHEYHYALLKFFKKQNIECVLILDNLSPYVNNEDIIWYSDEEVISQGFYGNHSFCPSFYIKDPSSWDKALYYLNSHNDCDHYVFMEDDVYCPSFNTFYKLFEKMNRHDIDFYSFYISDEEKDSRWKWREFDFYFPPGKRYNSFNPLCRVSSFIIKKLLEMRSEIGKFAFHESMFAGIVGNHNLSYVDITQDFRYAPFFYKFGLHPVDYAEAFERDKICHPVKLIPIIGGYK